MNILKVVTEKLKKKPDLLTVMDLVEVGIYGSQQSAYMARLSGKCPPYLRIPSRGIVYPKDQVIAFLQSTIVAIGQPQEKGIKNAQKHTAIASKSKTDSNVPLACEA